MTDLVVDESIEILAQVFDDDDDYNPEDYAHIIKRQGSLPADKLVHYAYENGIEIEALCGHRFAPTKGTETLPVCPKCMAIFGD